MLTRFMNILLAREAVAPSSVRRGRIAERLEARCVMDAALPIHVGLVYVETDYLESGFSQTAVDNGDDSQPDQFQLSFVGGAEGTQLTRLIIDTDKDGDGLSVGDAIFDTQQGGRGKGGAHGFQVIDLIAANPAASVTAEVIDGGMRIALDLKNFQAGDKLIFSADVDEVLRVTDDLAVFNSRLDVIKSGQEFQDSILTASFVAPNYYPVTGSDIFENDYGDPASRLGLDLPPDSGDSPLSRADRTAAALLSVQQSPRPISISGTVYLDDDLNLIQSTGEPGIADVLVQLLQLDEATGRFESTGHSQRTDAVGDYHFGPDLGLLPGTYRVEETQPDGLYSVGAVPGTVDGSLVGTAATDDVLTGIEIPLGDLHAIDYDFAEARPAQISGFVYRDDSDDGIKDASEPGLASVGVRLIPVDTISLASIRETVTAADGSYSFTNLPPGQYRVIETTMPHDLSDGLDSAGTVDGIRVGLATNPGDEINDIALSGGSVGIDYNFGELPLGSLSGFVYLAEPGEDCTGVHDPDEDTPLAGVRVLLHDARGTTVAETRTDERGGYQFNRLLKGDYTIIEITPDGLLEGGAHAGEIKGVTVGVSSGGSRISTITLPAGGDGTEYNFCETAPASISGHVYHDTSNDGVRDNNESPIADALVELIDASGEVVASQRTDPSGYYVFEGVLPGAYSIRETTPVGLIDGLDTAGTVDAVVVGRAQNPGDLLVDVVLRQGQTGIDYDFGELMPGRISGSVHADSDGDCEIDPDEQRLSGVVIELYDDFGNLLDSTTTNNRGQYEFTGLAPGSYTVVEIQPFGFYDGSQHAGTTGGDDSVTNRISRIPLESGQNSEENDFCELPPGSISGFVHVDSDGDCEIDASEQRLEGVAMELYAADGSRIATTTTDRNGFYQFDGVAPGTYSVVQIQPAGYFDGDQRAGTTGGDASGKNLITDIALLANQDSRRNDFCEHPGAMISGYVFQDGAVRQLSETPRPKDLRAISDGLRTGDDTPLAGVTLELRNVLGQAFLGENALPGVYPDGPIRTVTNADGFYQFTGLASATYHVYQIQPEGYIDGLDTPGSEGGYAVNAADQPDDALVTLQLQTLALTSATDPGMDGIILIDLPVGGEAIENNFSEVLIEPTKPFPPEVERPVVMTPAPVIESFPGAPLLISFADAAEITEPIWSELEIGVTWHLSIIDGGFPRGSSAVQTSGGKIIQSAGHIVDTAAWSSNPRNRGVWTLMDREGNVLGQSSLMEIGDEDAIPVAGDFNGDGQSELALFIAGNWYIDVNGNGRWDANDLWVKLGTEMDRPVVGDWNGDGKDDIGIFGPEWQRDPEAIVNDPGLPDGENYRRHRPKNTPPMEPEATDGQRLLKLKQRGDLRSDLIDHVFRYGHSADQPVAGDWNGDGIDAIAVFRGGRWMLDTNGDGRWTGADDSIIFGQPGDTAVVGDWNGDGIDDLGVVRGDQWIIDSNGDRKLSDDDTRFRQPDASGSKQPVVGDWNGDGADEAGSYETGDEEQQGGKAA